VLLPSDTHRKSITSITAVLLPFVTYLLTLPHNLCFEILNINIVNVEQIDVQKVQDKEIGSN
jgi:hypothetical protein